MILQRLYIGTGIAETGIYSCTLNLETGEISKPSLIADAPKPGFLAVHPARQILYAVTAEDSQPDGAVRAYQFDPETGALKFLNKQSSGDVGATHLEIDRAGQLIVVAHYQGGSVSTLPVDIDGLLEPVACFEKHRGRSVDPQRQFEPFAHGVAITRDSRFVCVADLGTDEIIVYAIDEKHQLVEADRWKASPGAGPRHLMFHPTQKWLYCINELDNTIDVLAVNENSAELKHLQNISTLPVGCTDESATAELVVHANGRFVYGSNRGHNSTVIFEVDQATGTLTQIDFEPTQGDHPRFIGMDPSCSIFVAANRNSDSLVSFRVDAETGKLAPTGFKADVPKPTCVVFIS